jgi:hypothetical protein
MADTLTQLIVKLQALLLGDATTFTTATCTAAIRQALKDLNLSVPMHAADTVVAVAEQYEYELEESNALEIVDVLRQGLDLYADENITLSFDGYYEDDRPFFRLRIPQSDGEILIVRYTLPYTINGLDSSTDSTLPSLHDVVLLDGAAWQACLVRSAGRIETVNMNEAVSENFRIMAEHFKQAFELGLFNLSKRHFPVSQPDQRTWSDDWAGQY